MLLTAKWEPISFNSKVGASSNSLNKERVFFHRFFRNGSIKSNSKHEGHVKYLNNEVEWWQHSKLQELISNCEDILSRLNKLLKNKNH